MSESVVGIDDKLLLTILNTATVKEPESVVPLLLIGLGGTGARVMQRVKWRAKWLGMEKLVRFLIIDSDRATKTGENGYPGFEDHEFVYLQSQPGRVILRNPDLHPDIKSRLDLDDADTLFQLRNFVEAGHDGAGQVPRNATLKFYGSFGLFQNRVNEAITHLTRRWADISRKDVGSVRTFNTILVSSVCGGTGAGILVDVACALENMLSVYESHHLMAILTLPEVYDGKVKGKKDDHERMRANTYATLRELEYFRSGKAHQDGYTLSRQIQTPAKDMFTSVSVVSRVDANGQDLGNDLAVYDSIALYLGAFVGQTLQRVSFADLCNDNPTNIDPRLKQHRNIGTIAATALSLPFVDLLGYCTYQQARELVNDFVLGLEQQADAINQQVDTWLQTNELEERASKDSDLTIERLRRATAFQAAQIVNRLYAHVSGSVVLNRKDRDFVRAFEAETQNWQQKDRPRLLDRLNEQIDPVVQEAEKTLGAYTTSLIHQSGLRPAVQFLRQLAVVLNASATELDAEVATDKEQSKKFLANAKAALKPLSTFFGQMGTDKARQARVVQELRNAIHLDGTGEIKKVAQRILKTLTDKAGKLATSLSQTVESWQRVKAHLDELSAAHRLRVGHIPFGESQAELSAMTPEMADAFYSLHRLKREVFRQGIEVLVETNFVDWIQKAGARKNTLETITLLSGRHYMNHILQLDIAAMLEKESKEENGDKTIRKHLEAALINCTPLWQARLGQADVRFEDGFAVGRPSGADDTFTQVVDSCNAQIANNPAYQSQINDIQTHDRMRIYAIRRIAGGLPYYLASWEEYRKCYQSWQKKAGHNCVHTLSHNTASRLPAMEPMMGITEGERAFALGLAFGWIARRGKFYYFNVYKNDADQFVVPINSHADCVAFEGKQLRENPGTLKTLINNDTMKFESRNPTPKNPKLGGDKGGRRLAEKELAGNPAAIELIRAAYDQLCIDAGNDLVSKDLEVYVNVLKQTATKADADSQDREIEVLEQEINALKSSSRR